MQSYFVKRKLLFAFLFAKVSKSFYNCVKVSKKRKFLQSPLCVKIMSERKEIKQRLQPLLPYGSFSKIKRAILANSERDLTVEYIRSVLNPRKDKWDFEVIKEAQVIALAVQAEIIELKENLA